MEGIERRLHGKLFCLAARDRIGNELYLACLSIVSRRLLWRHQESDGRLHYLLQSGGASVFFLQYFVLVFATAGRVRSGSLIGSGPSIYMFLGPLCLLLLSLLTRFSPLVQPSQRFFNGTAFPSVCRSILPSGMGVGAGPPTEPQQMILYQESRSFWFSPIEEDACEGIYDVAAVMY